MQTLTSRNTSINAVKLPAVYRKVKQFRAGIILDYGCGKHIDHIIHHLTGKTYLPYDPFNQPERINRATQDFIRQVLHTPNSFNYRPYIDVVCSNVLNVIDDPETIRMIAERIEKIAAGTKGTAYITVYEGNRSGIGKQTGPDQYQRNEPLRSYLKYFRNGTIKNGMIVVSANNC